MAHEAAHGTGIGEGPHGQGGNRSPAAALPPRQVPLHERPPTGRGPGNGTGAGERSPRTGRAPSVLGEAGAAQTPLMRTIA